MKVEVPKISLRISGVEQRPYNKIVGYFPLGRPLEAVLPSPPSQCSSTPGEYFFKHPEGIRRSPGQDSEINSFGDEGFAVTVSQFLGSWVEICREGVKIGYVPHDALIKKK